MKRAKPRKNPIPGEFDPMIKEIKDQGLQLISLSFDRSTGTVKAKLKENFSLMIGPEKVMILAEFPERYIACAYESHELSRIHEFFTWDFDQKRKESNERENKAGE